jgi:hypothetical protein
MSSTAEARKAHTICCGVLIFQYSIRYFNNGLTAPACWAIIALAINDMAAAAPTIALVAIVFIFNAISLWQVDTLGTPKSSDHPWIRSH